jgi:AraC-like DNA-binding protein
VRYQEFTPSPAFRPIVEKYWILEGASAPAKADQWECILPDGRAEVIFHYGERFARRGSDAHVDLQPGAMFVGQISAPACIQPRGTVGVAAIRLRAEATGVLGPAASTLTDRFEPLDALAPTGLVLEQLAGAGSDRQKIEVLERFLAGVVREAPRPEVAFAAACLVRHGGAVSIDAVASLTGVGRRQLERWFQSDVGLTPKSFARLLRVNRAARLVLAETALADVAAACGYFDQAHMSNDFRRLIQQSPHEWQRMAGTLGPLFVGPPIEHRLDAD